MNESQVDVIQLQKRDPQAWTVLLSSQEGLEDVIVTAVVAQPLQNWWSTRTDSRHLTRYLVSLANHSDPIPFISKTTNLTEAYFYQDLAKSAPTIAPRCWYSHITEDQGWIVLDEVPNHVQVSLWSPEDVDIAIKQMAKLHVAFWDQPDLTRHYKWLNHIIGREEKLYTWEELQQDYSVFFDQGPAALLSDHALQHVGRLAPKFLQAANGLAVLKALGGWPGVLGESHLAAIADLIDDPVPMLEPLQRLPATLLHGSLSAFHCHITFFEDHRLLDWQNLVVGPGICDLIYFHEQLDLIYSPNNFPQYVFQKKPPVTAETLIDSYLLTMKAQLGGLFDSREMRMAIPAARCLYVLTNWMPYFATWFDKMPNKYVWQRVNRMPQVELDQPGLENMIGLGPQLRQVFQRFLQAYRML